MLAQKIAILKQQLVSNLQQRQVPQAKLIAHTILQHTPNDAGIWFILGQINESLNIPSEAITAYSKASEATSPNQVNALERLSFFCLDSRLYGEALSAADNWLDLEPTSAVALQRKGFALCQLKQSEYGLKLIKKAHASEPENASIHICLAETLLALGHVDDAIKVYDKNKFYRSSLKAFARFLETQNYSIQNSRKQVLQYAKEFGDFLEADTKNVARKPRTYDSKRSIRLGYLSPDFRKHSVAHFMQPIYQHHNRDSFEIFSYYDGASLDDTSEFFKSKSEHWRDTRNLTDEALAQKISEDKIDILVDLAVHTATKPRARVFAMQPAAIQINYLGYPNTSGIRQMTHRLVDAYTDPVNQAEQFCTEQLIHLPNGFLCFQPAHADLKVSVLPANKNSALTYGSFNSGLKISDKMLRLWAQLLEKVPSSKLIIKNSCMRDTSSTQVFRERCLEAGLDLERTELLPFAEKQEDHLALYNRIDIHLDTHPYSGTTTTFEALWMGVPSITLAGDTHRSRVTGSILSRLDLHEFIAVSEAEYLTKCSYWDNNFKELGELRASLRDRLTESKMMNAKAFTKELEGIFTQLIQCPN